MICGINIYRLKIPLRTRFDLSFGSVSFFDTFVVSMVDNDKNVYYGECTSLPGYSNETPENIWNYLKTKSPQIIGNEFIEAIKYFDNDVRDIPFSATPLLSCLEKSSPTNQLYNIPISGVINRDDVTSLETEINSLILSGVKTIKIKVGRNLKKDIEKIQILSNHISSNVRIRIDANRGYTFDDAKYFVTRIPLDKVEHIEEPLRKTDFHLYPTLKTISKVPLMLDESIFDITDIQMAHDNAYCDIIKFKLFKHGSPERTETLIRNTLNMGVGVILGNGIQSEIGCILEARIYNNLKLNNAAEFNGFLKPCFTILDKPIISLKEGCMMFKDVDLKLGGSFKDAIRDHFSFGKISC